MGSASIDPFFSKSSSRKHMDSQDRTIPLRLVAHGSGLVRFGFPGKPVGPIFTYRICWCVLYTLTCPVPRQPHKRPHLNLIASHDPHNWLHTISNCIPPSFAPAARDYHAAAVFTKPCMLPCLAGKTAKLRTRPTSCQYVLWLIFLTVYIVMN
jgi:hypothetical protein